MSRRMLIFAPISYTGGAELRGAAAMPDARFAQEDGVIRIHGLDDEDSTIAFSEFGIESLQNLIEIYRENKK